MLAALQKGLGMGYVVELPTLAASCTVTMTPITGWPVPTLNPFADYAVAEDIVKKATAADKVSYSDSTKTLTLEPVYLPPDMVAAGGAVSDRFDTTGNWDIVVKQYRFEGMPVASSRWLEAYNCAADNDASARSRYLLPHNPKIVAWVSRAKVWEPVGFFLSFGGMDDEDSYWLMIPPTAPPQLFYRDELLSTMPSKDKDMMKFYAEEDVKIEILCVSGRLHIIIQGLTDDWIIPDIASIPAGTWAIHGNGGSFEACVYAQQYQTTGTLTRRVLDTQYARTSTPYLTTLYPPAADVLVTTSSTPDTSGARSYVKVDVAGIGAGEKIITYTLTGDGYHTPRLQAVQHAWRGAFAVEEELDGFAVDGFQISGEETIPEELRDRTLTLVLHDYQGLQGDAFSASLALWASTYSAGHVRVTYSIGWVNADASVSDMRRGTLAATLRREQGAPSGEGTYTLECVDRMKLWDKIELYWAPCGQGMTVQEYLTLLLEYVGVTEDETDWSGYSQAARIINAPGCNYDTPAWLPTPYEKAGPYLDRFCRAFGLRLEFDVETDALLVLDRLRLRPEVYRYDTFAATDPELTAHGLDVARDLQSEDAVNAFITVGKRGDGEKVYGQDIDGASVGTPGTDGYMGKIYSQTAVDDDITDQGHAQEQARRRLQESTTGLRGLAMTGTYSLWYLLSRHLVLLDDGTTTAGGKNFRTAGVRNRIEPSTLSAAAELREIKPGTWTHPTISL